jgi:hypothetical protein
MVFSKKEKKMSIEKEEKLKEIEKLLATYGKDGLEIDAYVLKYLSLEALQEIELKLLQKQSDVIADNHAWLQQFKKEY